MSAGAQIDYGAHSAVAPPIDYGDHAPAEKPIGEQPATVGGVASTMADQAGRFLGAAWENVNPSNLLKAGLHPIDTAHAMFGATVDALDRFDAARKKGDWKEAANSMVGAIPLLGPAGEQIVKEIEDGKHAEALGHAAGLRLVLEAPNAIAKAGDAAAFAAKVATDPEVVRAAVKVLPKGPAMIAAHDTIQGAIQRARGAAETPAAPTIPEGIDPELWGKLTPEMQERLRTGKTAAPASAPAPQAPRDPSYYGVGNEPNTPVRPPIAEKPAEAPTPKEAPPSDLTQKLNDLLRKVKIEGGFDPDKPLGEVKGGRYSNRFAGDDSPIINSAEQRTSGSNLPVANPGMVAKNIADKISDKVSVEMFDKIMKNPNGVRVLGALQQEGYVPDTEVIAMIRRRLMKRTNISNEMMNKVGK